MGISDYNAVDSENKTVPVNVNPGSAPIEIGKGIHSPQGHDIQRQAIQRIMADLKDFSDDVNSTLVAGAEFDAIADAEAGLYLAAPDAIRVRGYTAAGDGGEALYKKVASEPSHLGKFSITVLLSTVWYEIAEPVVSVKMFGATGDGATDDRAACQAAVDYIVGLGGGNVMFPTGEYLLEPTASPGTDAHDDGIVIPFTGFTVDNAVRLIGEGLAVLKAGDDDMIVVRVCQPGSEIIGLDIDGGCTVGGSAGSSFTNVVGIGLVAEDRSQTITLVSQSFCKVIRNHIHQCAEGLILEPGPTVAASQSGAFYPVIEGNHFNFNIRHMWFKPSTNDATNRPTRGNIFANRIERGNTGVDLEYATEFTLTGNYFQFFLAATYGTAPKATVSAIHVGALSENNWVIAGANEASDNYFWNEGTLPNALQLLFTPIGSVSVGLSFNPHFEAHGIRLTRRTASYEQIALTAHHSGFARLVFDYGGANVRDASIEVNSVRIMGWASGVTTHYGTLGNFTFSANGAQVDFTRVGANNIFVPSGGSLNLGITSGTRLAITGTNINPSSDNAIDFGTAALRLNNAFARAIRPGAGTATWTSGTGTPEGAVTATVGSLFTRTDGGAVTTLYVKESGAGNTGWVAK